MTTLELVNLLENNFEDLNTTSTHSNFTEWLSDNDNRREPTTVRGMLSRLNLSHLEETLLNATDLGLCTLSVDDRALTVTVNL